MTSSINKTKTICLKKNKSKLCQCGTESRTGNYSLGQSSQSHCRQVSAIIGSACNSTELNKNQKNVKHHQGRMESKMGGIILLYIKTGHTYLITTVCNSVLYLSKWVVVRIRQIKAIRWWTSREKD